MMNEIVEKISHQNEVIWINPDKRNTAIALKEAELSIEDITDAEKRLQRFAPLIKHCFPETEAANGLIESNLIEIEPMKQLLQQKSKIIIPERLLLKKDSHLAIAGSVKARGGIYEVLKHTEDLALAYHLITMEDDYATLADHKDFFSRYKIQVGSTGNLGLSIGITSAVLGYQVIVHMSSDAKKWKKDLLRSYGVKVVEYDSDYSEAVKEGRKQSEADPNSYFVDDENSRNLFLGYAVSARRLGAQLEKLNAGIDADHPCFVFLPCGVGGAPGGITFGLKSVFKDDIHCFFVEPTQACCMTLGLCTGLNQNISVQDVGLSGKTEADGLAVGRPSSFVGQFIRPFVSGCMTVRDDKLFEYMKLMKQSESLFLEPSACAGFAGVENLHSEEFEDYLEKEGLKEKMKDASIIVWATGGSLVPPEIQKEYLERD